MEPNRSAPVPAPPVEAGAVPRAGRLWLAVLGSPAAWAADQLLRYGLIRTVNATQRMYLLHLVTAATLLTTIVCGLVCARERRLSRQQHVAASEVGNSGQTLALWGVALALYFGLLILGQAFPTLILGPRDLT